MLRLTSYALWVGCMCAIPNVAALHQQQWISWVPTNDGIALSKRFTDLGYDDAALSKRFRDLDSYTVGAPQNANQLPPSLKDGLAFVKVPKVGGSTWAGVMRRIGHRHFLNHVRDGSNWLTEALEIHEPPTASVWSNHGRRDQIDTELKQFMPNAPLITLVRDPVDRQLSAFYHMEVARRGTIPTIGAKVGYLESALPTDVMNYISARHDMTPEEAIASYMFVGVTERFDESLLLLGWRLSLNTTDLLYLKSKVAGTVATGRADKGAVMPAHPPFAQEPHEVQDAARSLQTGVDAHVYKLANEALDKAIAEYGTQFQTDLREFQDRLHQLENACRQHFQESCLWNDNGCAQDCIDQYAHQKGW